MKIVFVHFGRENLGIEYLSTALKHNGHDVALVCDAGLFSSEDNVFSSKLLRHVFSRKHIVRDILAENPDLIAFSVYTTTHVWANAIAQAIKKIINIPIVFGGIHPTLVPEEVLKHSFIDYVHIGEGEYTFVQFVKALEKGRRYDVMPNIGFVRKEEVIMGPLLPPTKDLDDLPFPDKGLFESLVDFKDDYMILTSKGCLFSCSYCCESFMNTRYANNYFRRRSVHSVIAELSLMKKRYHFREVMFFDSILCTDKVWLRELMEGYKQAIAVPFRCEGHVSCFDEDIGRILKDGGCYCVNFGVQTFNEKIRTEVLHRHERNEQVRRAFDICDSLQLRYDVDLMIGLPDMTEEDYLLPIIFMRQHTYFNRIKCYYLTYFPRLPIVAEAQKRGVLSDYDLAEIEKGYGGNWFHQDSIIDMQHRRWKDNFERFYKLYPLLPQWMLTCIIQRKWYRFLYKIPKIFVIFAQLCVGIWKRDYRFYIYVKSYLTQSIRVFSTYRGDQSRHVCRSWQTIQTWYKTICALVNVKIFRRKTPLAISWDITERCNGACLYCSRNKEGVELSFESCCTIIRQLAANGTRFLSLTGGEPLMREDIGAIINYAHTQKLFIKLNTNGLLLQEKIRNIKGVDLIQLSCDGCQDKHDYIRGEGSFARMMCGLAAARKNNIKVVLNTVISKENSDSLRDVLDIAKTFNVSAYFQPARHTILYDQKKNQLALDPQQYCAAVKDLIALKQDKAYAPLIANSREGLEHLLLWPNNADIGCYAGLLSFRIDSKGMLYGCNANKGAGTDIMKYGVRKALHAVHYMPCMQCWCATQVESNLVLGMNVQAIQNYFFKK